METVLDVCRDKCKAKGKAVQLQACSGPEGSRKLMLQDFVTTAQDDGEVVSLMQRPSLGPGYTPGTLSCCRLDRTLRKNFMSMKSRMISTGIEPATFRFLAQRFNHCATAVLVPLWRRVKSKVKCTLVQALRLSSGRTAVKENTGIALLFLTTSLEGVRVYRHSKAALTIGKDMVPNEHEAE